MTLFNFKGQVLAIVRLFHSVKDEKLRWLESNQDRQERLRQAHALAEQELEAELKKRSLQLTHELTLLQTKHETELSMFKTQCRQDIEDYKQYLHALDQLKRSIQKSYTHLPEAVAFTIHHHAKYLLNLMWETAEHEQKMYYELQLIEFMTAVHEDARLYLQGEMAGDLPENTLKLIKHQ